MERAKELLEKNDLMSLKELLAGGAKGFIVAHGGQIPDGDRAYLTAWAVASYLMFDRRLTETPKSEIYLKAINSGVEPVESFEKWVGQGLPEFEKNFQSWLKRLKPDGTLADPS